MMASPVVAPGLPWRLELKDLPIVRRLGRGLSGYLYETRWGGKKYARKDFPLGLEKRNGLFETEVKLLFNLDHPNIVKCFGYTVGQSSCSLLQEYVDDNLQNTVQRKIDEQRKRNSTSTSQPRVLDVDGIERLLSNRFKGKETVRVNEGTSGTTSGSRSTIPFDVHEAEYIIFQIAAGMKYLHDNEVIHGDLKPRNVLQSSESGERKLKVADLGLSKTKRAIKLASKHTRHFEILTWKAPELLKELLGPLTIDSDDPFTDSDTDSDEAEIGSSDSFVKSKLAMADVYSFGLTCSYVLGGKLMYPDLRLTQLREQRMQGFKPELPNACPDYLKSMIYSCLESEPPSRPSFSDICAMNIEEELHLHHPPQLQMQMIKEPLLPTLMEHIYSGIVTEAMESDVRPPKRLHVMEDGESLEPLSPISMQHSYSGSVTEDGESLEPLSPISMQHSYSGSVTEDGESLEPLSPISMQHSYSGSVTEDGESLEPLSPISMQHSYSGSVTEAMKSDVRPPKRPRVMEDKEILCSYGFANYDVFISHRGSDTKTGFVSFLHDHLVAAGLRPFLDCKSIDIGEDSWGCIEHAIRKTPIAVVIFSKTFAQSEWCMRELHLMLHTPSVTVLPVFYNVRPSEVRFPGTGQLKEGFEKLTGRHEKKEVDDWRADLEQASKLMGWEHSGADKRLEADLVSEVVDKVSELANKTLPLEVGEYFIGVEQVAEEIIQTLDENKKFLGLLGMGGIGKSTLARELYNQLCKRRFDSTCYVEDVTEKVNQGGVVRVQSRILNDLCKNGSVEIEDKSKGKVVLEERLSGRRILLVLDDVRDKDEMDYWISSKMLSRGSLCIATSRNRRVFETSNSFAVNHEVHIHYVQALSGVDSERVFASHAFGGHGTVKKGFEELATNISKACGGVPLVLKVCGALLKGEEDVVVWKEVMMKLNCGSIRDEDKLFARLRISYDALQHEHRGMFLDIACVLLGQLKDLAIRFWKAQGLAGALGVRSLVEKALITVDGDGMLSMHDHLRDMGREIVAEERRRDGVCKRLWMPESLSVLKEDEALQGTLESMIAYINDDDAKDDADDNEVDDDEDESPKVTLNLVHLKRLRILICAHGVSVTSRLPTNLCWLDLQGYMHTEGTIFQATPSNQLVILTLKDSNIQNLPESFGNFSQLEVLNLNSCGKLKKLPKSFGRLRTLQQLELQNSGIQSLPESFGELGKLEVLDLSGCGELRSLPNSFGGLRSLQLLQLKRSGMQILPESFGELRKLEVLDLSGCGELRSLPYSFGGLRSLQQLQLYNSGMQSLPESFGELGKLEVLDLSGCGELRSLPNSFGGLRSLQQLQLYYSGIQSLPESFGELRKLEVLDLSGCGELRSLPNSFGGLRSLQQLQLYYSGIQSLPESFGELGKLEVLDLSGCGELRSLPYSFGGLRSLQQLQLYSSGMQNLPESFGELGKLEVLDLSGCGELRSLPYSFGGLRSLQQLQLYNSGMQSLPESFGELGKLEVLDLSGCGELRSLPNSFGGLRSLQQLQLKRSGMQSLPESFGELGKLEVLDLSGCGELRSLPNSFGGLRSLQQMQLKRSGMQSLPESFGELGKLEVLDLSGCGELRSLPNSFGGLRSLQQLQLYISAMQSLPESFGELGMLQVLDLSGCGELRSLPNSFGGLRSLQQLQLKRSGMQSLPESFGELGKLEVLDLSGCGEVRSLPNSFGGLRSLQQLQLYNSGMQSLPESFGELGKLQVLDLSGCEELRLLPNSFGGLRSLQQLQLYNSGMQSLPESFGELGKLEVLDLSGCGELRSLPNSFGGLRSLQQLQLKRSGMQSLPESFGELGKLEVLDLSGCGELRSLPNSFGGLRSLQQLQLYNSGMQSLPESFGELRKLEVLDLSGCGEVRSLPNSFGGLRSLQQLQLYNSAMQSLPESFGELGMLQVLDLSGCGEVRLLPNSFGGLRSLQQLQLYNSGMQSLPESFGELGKLEVLDLSGCGELRSLPNSFGGLRSLQLLQLKRSGMQSLPESFGELRKLEVLDLSGCGELRSLPNSFGGLRSLQQLQLKRSGMQSLPESFGELGKLEVLDLSGCGELRSLPNSFRGLRSLQQLQL